MTPKFHVECSPWFREYVTDEEMAVLRGLDIPGYLWLYADKRGGPFGAKFTLTQPNGQHGETTFVIDRTPADVIRRLIEAVDRTVAA